MRVPSGRARGRFLAPGWRLALAGLLVAGGIGVLGLQGEAGTPPPAAVPAVLAAAAPAPALAAPRSGTDVVAATATLRSLLRGPETFAHISDEAERARQLFTEMARVLTHPRCVNCHPSGDRPLQGEDGRPHEPPVVRGAGGMGAPGMMCTTCHASENVRVLEDWSMPGHPNWHLAPASMAWAGRSPAEICAQIQDPGRNGGMSLDELVHHLGEDGLVGWAWAPGPGREPPPGTQGELGELARAWAEAGAECPEGAGG